MEHDGDGLSRVPGRRGVFMEGVGGKRVGWEDRRRRGRFGKRAIAALRERSEV